MISGLPQEPDCETAATGVAAGHLTPGIDPEQTAQSDLLAQARGLRFDRQHVARQASAWISSVRANRQLSQSEAMLDAFGLATREGRALMRLAEALLRTPDRSTAWKLLRENLCDADWQPPSTAHTSARITAALLRWTAYLVGRREQRVGLLAAVILRAARHGIGAIADHFIVAETVPAALQRMRRDASLHLCSIDCLGESARTTAQAQAYLRAYEDAIGHLGRQQAASLQRRHGISVKLSALEPRFGPRHRGTYGTGLIPKMQHLARLAAQAGIGITVDAEEQDRLESTLDVLAALIDDSTTREWQGLGLAVQAYGPRALQVIAWLADRARTQRRRMTVRLVKGAYWDSEIKRAQERGLDAFPVFSNKHATDTNYLVAAQRLFEQRSLLFPQFATHNAMTIAAVRTLAPPGAEFEFQRLYGMGEQLYRVAAATDGFPPVRVYAPVGSRQDLLAYLVRRLLENGANTSFVHHLRDPATAVRELLQDPVEALSQQLRQEEPAPADPPPSMRSQEQIL